MCSCPPAVLQLRCTPYIVVAITAKHWYCIIHHTAPDQTHRGTTFSVTCTAVCATSRHNGVRQTTSFALGLSCTCRTRYTRKLVHEHDITASNNHHVYCAAVLRWCAQGSRALRVVLTPTCTDTWTQPITNIMVQPRYGKRAAKRALAEV